MSAYLPVRPAKIEAAREQAVEVLTEHFSRDVMDLDKFEGLLDAVNRCSTTGELRELLSKLPPLASSKPATDMMPAPGGVPVVVNADRVNDDALAGRHDADDALKHPARTIHVG